MHFVPLAQELKNQIYVDRTQATKCLWLSHFPNFSLHIIIRLHKPISFCLNIFQLEDQKQDNRRNKKKTADNF